MASCPCFLAPNRSQMGPGQFQIYSTTSPQKILPTKRLWDVSLRPSSLRRSQFGHSLQKHQRCYLITVSLARTSFISTLWLLLCVLCGNMLAINSFLVQGCALNGQAQDDIPVSILCQHTMSSHAHYGPASIPGINSAYWGHNRWCLVEEITYQ